MDFDILEEKGYQDLKYGGAIYDQMHPDTNHPFQNFKIPFFKESDDICSKFARLMTTEWIGWDIPLEPV